MSVKTCHPRGRRREEEQELLHVEAAMSKRRKDEEKECMQQLSQCPACTQECDVVLILPCSHTMCAPCIAAGEGASSAQHHRVRPPVCSVPCPRCRHPVELPCRTWSSATSCLPKHPTPSPARVSRESEDPLQLEQVDARCRDVCGVTEQSCAHGSSFTEPPEDGALDLGEEEMEQSVCGLCFSLDPSTAHPSLHLSNSSLTVAYKGHSPPGPPGDPLVRRPLSFDPCRIPVPLVCADVVIRRGQYYWEVDVCNSSIYRIGVSALDASCGWWLERHGPSFCAVYDGSLEPLGTVPPQIKTLGVFLNVGGGALSFHNPLTQEHLATLSTRFNPTGVRPALGLRQGRLRIRCGLPPPAHVFLSKDSSYRGPRGAGPGRWQRDFAFQSVRKVIQKFEELAVSDSDSGLVSSFGSSCSTLASLPDLGIPGPFPCGPPGQETAAE